MSIHSIKALEVKTEDCIEFYTTHQNIFQEIADYYNCPLEKTVAIALPEVIRYKGWQNDLERMALEQFYVKGGKIEADFSIGYFQMKPSFIEDLECEIVENPHLLQEFSHLIPNGDWSQEKSRKFRIERLNITHLQFEYLCAFYKIMENKYCDIDEKNKLNFFASAFNYGFKKPKEKIQNWANIKAFPYGSRFKFEQDAFADVSTHLYDLILSNKNSCMN